jgi:hypothetical protein
MELYNPFSKVVVTLSKTKKLNSVALVCRRTIPFERPSFAGELIANFCG